MNRRIVETIFLLTLFFAPLSAQNITLNCPTITIETPKSLIWPKQPEALIAHVSGAQTSAKLTFLWASTVGTIVGEFGSPSMSLVTQKNDAGARIAVFVRVEGLPDGCPNAASKIVDAGELPIGEPVDKFGNVSRNNVKARIDNYYLSLAQNPPSHTGLIDVYFGPKESMAQRLARLDLILAAIRFRKHDIARVSFAFMESPGPPQTTLWIVPDGADVLDERPGAVFVKGTDVMKDPKKALPTWQCPCTPK